MDMKTVKTFRLDNNPEDSKAKKNDTENEIIAESLDEPPLTCKHNCPDKRRQAGEVKQFQREATSPERVSGRPLSPRQSRCRRWWPVTAGQTFDDLDEKRGDGDNDSYSASQVKKIYLFPQADHWS